MHVIPKIGTPVTQRPGTGADSSFHDMAWPVTVPNAAKFCDFDATPWRKEIRQQDFDRE
jgi:hypothetical protein